MEWEFWQIIGAIGALAVGLVVTIFAVKFAVSFDINKYLEYRRERQLEKLQTICPHTSITRIDSERLSIQSLLTSPPGTIVWICGQCGFQTLDSSVSKRLIAEWQRDPVGWKKQDEKFRKEAKKYLG